MPLIEPSTYQPPAILRNRHLHTIYAYLSRRANGVTYQRSRVDTPDHDFLDIDLSRVGSQTLLIIAHGLEGSADSTYVKSLVKAANARQWDVAAVNMRGCSGLPNNLYSSYHSGKTDDIALAIRYLQQQFGHEQLLLAGFSMGGNIMLKYAGESGKGIDPAIKAVACLSTPCDLRSAAFELSKSGNRLYMSRFLKTLKQKLLAKLERFPDSPVSAIQVKKARDFFDYDNLYTAPAHGFTDAEAYWHQCSSKRFITQIEIPALVVNALDDPFLGKDCYPFDLAGSQAQFFLETPRFGGHVGFVTKISGRGEWWHESRILDFLNTYV